MEDQTKLTKSQIYYRRNRQKLLEQSRERYKQKTEQPEDREKHLNYLKNYYHEVLKPKIAKEMKEKGKKQKTKPIVDKSPYIAKIEIEDVMVSFN